MTCITKHQVRPLGRLPSRGICPGGRAWRGSFAMKWAGWRHLQHKSIPVPAGGHVMICRNPEHFCWPVERRSGRPVRRQPRRGPGGADASCRRTCTAGRGFLRFPGGRAARATRSKRAAGYRSRLAPRAGTQRPVRAQTAGVATGRSVSMVRMSRFQGAHRSAVAAGVRSRKPACEFPLRPGMLKYVDF